MSIPLWEECRWFCEEEEKLISSAGIVLSEDSSLEPPFKKKDSINRRVHLYFGDIYKLPSDVIILGQSEGLTYRKDGIESIMALAGPSFEEEMSNVAPVQTGSCVEVNGEQPLQSTRYCPSSVAHLITSPTRFFRWCITL